MSVAPITPPKKSYFKYIANQLSMAGYSYPSATHKREKNAGLLGVSRGRKKKIKAQEFGSQRNNL